MLTRERRVKQYRHKALSKRAHDLLAMVFSRQYPCSYIPPEVDRK